MNRQRKVVITVTYNDLGTIVDTKAEELDSSAQPEHLVKKSGDLVKDLVNDCINRQDAVKTMYDLCEYIDDESLHIDVIVDALENLPSAEPEPMCINLNEPIKVKLTDWGKPIGDGRPLADSEVIPRLQDIKRQIGGSCAIERAIEVLEDLPSASPDLSTFSDKLWKIAYERGKAEGRKKGKWEWCGNHRLCSECDEWALTVWDDNEYEEVDVLTNFCPNCGADMRGEQDE